MTIEELIGKLEAATEGNRELDGEILRAANGPAWEAARVRASMPCGCPEPELTTEAMSYAALYTWSLDAALTLVPKGARLRELGQWDDCGKPGGWFAWITRWRYTPTGVEEASYQYGYSDENRMPKLAPSPALALCIAALKARLAQDDAARVAKS